MINKKKIALTIGVSFILSGCAFFRPYLSPVQQGKDITAKMVQQLKPGMSKTQVEYILGTPDIVDPFITNRWNYVYTLEQDYQPMKEHKLIITFKDDKLYKLAGDYPPPQVVYNVRDNSSTNNTAKVQKLK